MPAPASTLFEHVARGWRGYVLVALIALGSSLMGATRVGVMDIDEARFVQATRQMVETGDYVRIRLQEEERNRKPIGIHWMQAAAVNAMLPLTHRVNEIWPYRLPSALGIVIAALAALWGGTALLGARPAVVGAGLFAAGMLAGVEGMTAKTDAMLVGFTTLAIAALARLYRAAPDASPRDKRVLALVFWAALAGGVLIKGPITPIAAALTLATLALWERRAEWMRALTWWPGPLLAVLITAPWLVMIGVVTEGRFYADLLNNELGPKLAGTDHSHGGLPGYHLLILPFLIFPATYALPAAARLGWAAARAPANDAAQAPHRFLLAWAAPTFLMFELFPGKLLHYALPTYPAIALLCAAGLFAMRGRRWRTAHPAGLALFLVAGAAVVALMAASATFMPGDLSADVRRAVSAAIVGAFAVIGALVALLASRRATTRALALVLCALVLSYSLRERLLAESRSLFVSNEAAVALTRARLMPRADRPLWSVGYDEPSIVFLTATSTRLATAAVAGAEAKAGDAMLVEGRALNETAAGLARRNLAFLTTEEPVRGFALGSGHRVALYFGAVGPAAGLSGEAEDARPRSP